MDKIPTTLINTEIRDALDNGKKIDITHMSPTIEHLRIAEGIEPTNTDELVSAYRTVDMDGNTPAHVFAAKFGMKGFLIDNNITNRLVENKNGTTVFDVAKEFEITKKPVLHLLPLSIQFDDTPYDNWADTTYSQLDADENKTYTVEEINSKPEASDYFKKQSIGQALYIRNKTVADNDNLPIKKEDIEIIKLQEKGEHYDPKNFFEENEAPELFLHITNATRFLTQDAIQESPIAKIIGKGDLYKQAFKEIESNVSEYEKHYISHSVCSNAIKNCKLEEIEKLVKTPLMAHLYETKTRIQGARLNSTQFEYKGKLVALDELTNPKTICSPGTKKKKQSIVSKIIGKKDSEPNL